MAVICGEDGNVTFSDLVINCYAWSLDIEADMFPATKFGDNRFKSSVAGMLQWSGNLSWRMDSAAAADWAGNRGALVLTADMAGGQPSDARKRGRGARRDRLHGRRRADRCADRDAFDRI
jgi:hypothetical protein